MENNTFSLDVLRGQPISEWVADHYESHRDEPLCRRVCDLALALNGLLYANQRERPPVRVVGRQFFRQGFLPTVCLGRRDCLALGFMLQPAKDFWLVSFNAARPITVEGVEWFDGGDPIAFPEEEAVFPSPLRYANRRSGGQARQHCFCAEFPTDASLAFFVGDIVEKSAKPRQA